jgi:hypothetical protein
MRAKAAGYRKAPGNEDTIDFISLTPTNHSSRSKEQEPMDRFRRYEEVAS